MIHSMTYVCHLSKSLSFSAQQRNTITSFNHCQYINKRRNEAKITFHPKAAVNPQVRSPKAIQDIHLQQWSTFLFSSWRSSSSPASPWLTVSKNSFCLASAGKRQLFSNRIDHAAFRIFVGSEIRINIYYWCHCVVVPFRYRVIPKQCFAKDSSKKGGVSCIAHQILWNNSSLSCKSLPYSDDFFGTGSLDRSVL